MRTSFPGGRAVDSLVSFSAPMHVTVSAAFGRDRGATQVTELGVLEHKVDRIDRAAEHAGGVDSLIQVLARRVNGRVAHD